MAGELIDRAAGNCDYVTLWTGEDVETGREEGAASN